MAIDRWLLIDAGNSRMKWRHADGSSLGGGAMPHAEALRALRADGPGIAQAIAVASVADRSVDEGLMQLGRRWRLPLHWVKAQSRFARLRNAYAEPQRLGVDRWLAMVAVAERTSDAFAVASAGTALTFDLVDAEGQHLGGFIVPGQRLMRHSLLTHTAGVRVVERPAQLQLGRDTDSSVAAGLGLSAAGAIRLALARAGLPKLWLTGGDAAVLALLLDMPVAIDSELILHGLDVLARAGALQVAA